MSEPTALGVPVIAPVEVFRLNPDGKVPEDNPYVKVPLSSSVAVTVTPLKLLLVESNIVARLPDDVDHEGFLLPTVAHALFL